MKTKNPKFIYKCINCQNTYYSDELLYTCPKCSKENTPNTPPKGILKTIYDYPELHKKIKHKRKLSDVISDLLPISDAKNFPILKVGNTPLYKIENNKIINTNFNLYIKDDSQNPTFSFKDRASYIVSAYAKEHNIDTIITASTGNAGSSLAGICASQNQKAIIMVPQSAPLAKLTQIVMYGAKIVPIAGNYDQAFDLSIKATEHFGWYNRNTAYNPLTIEGKKTVSFELYQQLGDTIPDKVFVPVGDGVIISGVYKGFEDLLKIGLIDSIPTIVAVQAKGSNNIIQNLNKETFTITPGNTIADSISVDIPRNFYMAEQYITQYNGETEEVTDDEILKASKTLSQATGIFAEPAAATAFAGMLKQQNKEKITQNSNVIVLSTGSGLKDLNSVQKLLSIPKGIEPNISELTKLLS